MIAKPMLVSTIIFMLTSFKIRVATNFLGAILILSGMTSLSHAENEQAIQVYKTVSPDGSISYSDTPTDNAQSISVQPIPTIPAVAPIPKFTTQTGNTVNTPEPYEQVNYKEFSFIEPLKNSSFHSASGTVQVALQLTPNLIPQNKVKILLDGKPVAIQKSLTHTLTNIDRGTHSLTAHILSADNSILISTSTSFTIHRPSIKR